MICTLLKIFLWCSNATQHSGKFKHVHDKLKQETTLFQIPSLFVTVL